jgi:tetratricopeptide (TPR) repeat protein
MEEAEKYLAFNASETAEISRNLRQAWYAAANLATLRKEAGQPEEALGLIQKAREQFPNIWELAAFEAGLERELHGVGPALGIVADFTRSAWWEFKPWLALAQLQLDNGQPQLASEALRFACRLDIHDAKTLNQLAALELSQGKPAEAYLTQLAAIGRAPDEPSSYLRLGLILDRLGRTQEAEAARATACEQLAQARQLPR